MNQSDSRMGDGRLLALLHLCDSLFPLGGFAHSDGLEFATASGAIVTGRDLRAWLAACLGETIGRAEGPTALLAWAAWHDRAWERLVTLDGEATALRPSSTARRASRTMGARLLTTWQGLYPSTGFDAVAALVRDGRIGPTLPVAFGVVCAWSDIDQRSTAQAFAYTRLAATVSAAMRLMSIGQTEAHALLAEALLQVPAVVDEMMARGAAAESFAPMMDVSSMAQQYLHSRLFRS